jgi:hypothetical protein
MAGGAGQDDHADEGIIGVADEGIGENFIARGAGAEELNAVEGGLFGERRGPVGEPPADFGSHQAGDGGGVFGGDEAQG